MATVHKGSERWIYCKYCYKNVLPLVLREEVIPGRITVMTLCAECGYGLTPPEEVAPHV